MATERHCAPSLQTEKTLDAPLTLPADQLECVAGGQLVPNISAGLINGRMDLIKVAVVTTPVLPASVLAGAATLRG